MTDTPPPGERPDELDRLLRSVRPHTDADDDWASSPSAHRIRDAVRERTSAASPRRRRVRPDLRRPLVLGVGLAGAVAVATTLAVVTSPAPARHPSAQSPGTLIVQPGRGGPRPSEIALASYDSCASALAGLRAHTAANADKLQYPLRYGLPVALNGVAVPAASAPAATVPDHSTTNTQEAAVGEPDVVETDGRRIVSVANGTLEVVDVASRRVTGRLDLSQYAGAGSAQLLMSGDRVLVLLGSTGYAGGPIAYPVPRYPMPMPMQGSALFVLVDIAAAPRVVATLHPKGSYLDARLVDGEVRAVVQSTPAINPLPGLQATRTAVRRAPLTAWLPTYDVTAGGVTTSHRVPCTALTHPAHYTGTSLTTVYSFPLTGDLADPAPLTLAGDASTVYASTSSLYLTSGDGSVTRLHRFDITRPGRPVYLGSGRVPGWLQDSYSMSEYDGSLRVVTTDSSGSTQVSSLYVLDAATLRRTGQVGGLGAGEQVHGVRFLGPLAYVVTFRSVDPLHVLDLRDPHHPRLAGELVASGYSDYLHPVGSGRLLGVGQAVDGSRVAGLQVSLFDVADPARMSRAANIVLPDTPGEQVLDPHAFLYWPATGTAVVPIQSWNSGASGGALVVQVGRDSLTRRGIVRNPDSSGIERSLVVGDELWTMSAGGLGVQSLATLDREAWVSFG